MSDIGADIADALADYVSGTRYQDIPLPVVSAAKQSLMDTLAVAWAGTDAPGVAAVRGLLQEIGGPPESTVWALPARLPAGSAALLNSMSASALDFDNFDTGPGHLHADIVIVPATMAVAQRQHAAGRDFLGALILGNDLVCRIGRSTGGNRGWYLTSTIGVFGAAAVTARLLGLNREQTRHAIGIALASAGGTHQSIVEQTLTKRLHGGLAARAGVLAAQLAGRGITGPARVFQGRFGFYAMYQEGDAARAVDYLGERYAITDATFKRYPTCALTHAGIEAALRLRRAHGLRVEDIQRVRVLITPYMERLVGGAFDPKDNPQVTAQFNLKYCVAVALLRGRVSLEEIRETSVFDPAIQPLVDRVELSVDQTSPGEFEPAEVTVDTLDGGHLLARIDAMPGTPTNSLSPGDLRAKAMECFGAGAAPLRAEAAVAVIHRIDRLEECADMARFFEGIGAEG